LIQAPTTPTIPNQKEFGNIFLFAWIWGFFLWSAADWL